MQIKAWSEKKTHTHTFNILPVGKKKEEMNHRKAINHCLNNQNLPGRTYCQVS